MTVDHHPTAASGRLQGEIELVLADLAATTGRSDESVRKAMAEVKRFVVHLEVAGIEQLKDITGQVAHDFLHAASWVRGIATEPGLGTIGLRRDAIRQVVKSARRLGLVDPAFDPTVDMVLPSPTKRARRPLTDDEELRGRLAAEGVPTTTRRAAAWALGQASGITGELVAATVGDLDLERGRVWLRGTENRVPRWGSLTEWGLDRLRAHLDVVGDDPATHLIRGPKQSARGAHTTSCNAVMQVLELAGLRDDAGVTPMSLPNWAGRHVFDETGRIERAAETLGLRSLDVTARAIGWEWR